MEFAELDTRKGAEAGFELQLVHPKSGAPIEAWITVLGHDSKTYADAMMDMQRRWAKGLARNRAMTRTPEEIENEAVELLAAVTASWRGIELDGKPLAFSNENARAFYQRFPWAREQAGAAMGDRANFLPGSSKD